MSYSGDVLPEQCWERLESNSNSALVDVRTRVEWNFVGLPLLEQMSAPLLLQEWQVFPQMAVDPNFATSLKSKLTEANLDETAELYFLCRSGVRSLAAAQTMTASGFTACYNISGGFEGDLDQGSHRGSLNGWKAAGLPWKQT